MECRILKKTDRWIFLDKPAGLHSVGQKGKEDATVAAWLIATDPSQKALDPLEGGLCHRLDFDTSGIMVAARDREAREEFRDLIRQNKVVKDYVCITTYPPPGLRNYKAFAGSRYRSSQKVSVVDEPKDRFQPIETEITESVKEGDFYRVRVRLITGARHQIRAHLAFLSCPILGDELYRGMPADRLMLHAEKLAFEDDGEILEMTSPAPF